MLPKCQRLSVRDITSLSDGKGVFGHLLSIRYVLSKESKFSVSVSKKVTKNAVDRNKIRRRVYTAIREIVKKMGKTAFIMVLPKKECRTVPISSIRDEINSLMRKAGLIT